MVWGLLAMISFQVADMYFLSLLGTNALAALGFTIPATMFVLSLTIAMGISASSIVSRSIGAGDAEQAKRIATHALAIAGGMSLAISIAGMLLLDPVARALGAAPGIRPLIRDFLGIYFAGSVFMTLMMVGNAILRASGDSLSPALILAGCAAVNVALDPVLIFGLFGFPRLEMKGAALANVASCFVAMLAGLYILRSRHGLLARTHFDGAGFGQSLKRFAAIAVPVGIANVIQPLTNGAVTALLARTGHEAVAAYGIGGRVEALAFVVIMALAIGMGPVIGQNWGAGRLDRVGEALRDAFLFVFLWSAAVCAVLALFGRDIAGLFTDEPAVLDKAALYFWIVPASYTLGNLVNGWGSAFNAMGLPKYAFMLIVVRLLCVTLPLAWIGEWLAGAEGVFAGVAAANILMGAGSHILCRRFFRSLRDKASSERHGR